MRVDRHVGVRSSLGGLGWVVGAASAVSLLALLLAIALSVWLG
jgi:hypothetical protein